MLPFGGVNLEDINFSKTIALTTVANGLKLIAYDDRPEHRQKDLQDIGNIIKAYHRIADDLLFEEEHIDLLELDSPLKVAGQLLGRQLAPIIKSSKPLTDRVVGILARYPFIIEEELQSGVSISM